MMANQRSVDEWRKILTSQEMDLSISYLDELKLHTKSERIFKLKSRFPNLAPDVATVALETAHVREQLGTANSWHKDGFFLQSKNEQATKPQIAHHHAKSFTNLRVLEIGCGIGSDSSALASTAQHLTALDIDPRCCAIAQHNLELQGHTNVSFINSTLSEFLNGNTLDEYNGIWADPGRRTDDGERIYNPDLYRPPLHSILSLNSSARMGIKVSPALNIWDLESEWSHEMIGWEWGCPEQVLWKGTALAARQASLVDVGAYWHRSSKETSCTPHLGALKQGEVLLEPHPALVRTNECQYFYHETDIALLDPHLSFGITDRIPTPSPWLRAYQVIESFRYSLKSLRARLHTLQWDSRTQIKKRGLREQPDEIHRALKLPPPGRDSPWGFVILLKLEDSPQAILAERIR